MITCRIFGPILFLTAFALVPVLAAAQGAPNAGSLAPEPGESGAAPIPQGASLQLMKDLHALRDAVYGFTAAPAEIALMADELVARAKALSMDTRYLELVLSRIDYLAGRAWQPVEDKLAEKAAGGKSSAAGMDAGQNFDKKKAIQRHESAIIHAKTSMKEGESAAGWMALAAPLSQLCILKDMGYLVINGPKIGQYAKKALACDPEYVPALINLAAAKAYPPAIFGGNPEAAAKELRALLDSHPEGFERDELFDIRAGIGTAYVKMNDKTGARLWFSLALQLYPGNAYARVELAKMEGAK